MTVCYKCGQPAAEVCGDGYCRDCHVSLSFEDCVSDRYVNAIRAEAGLPPMPPQPADAGDRATVRR